MHPLSGGACACLPTCPTRAQDEDEDDDEDEDEDEDADEDAGEGEERRWRTSGDDEQQR